MTSFEAASLIQGPKETFVAIEVVYKSHVHFNFGIYNFLGILYTLLWASVEY